MISRGGGGGGGGGDHRLAALGERSGLGLVIISSGCVQEEEDEEAEAPVAAAAVALATAGMAAALRCLTRWARSWSILLVCLCTSA